MSVSEANPSEHEILRQRITEAENAKIKAENAEVKAENHVKLRQAMEENEARSALLILLFIWFISFHLFLTTSLNLFIDSCCSSLYFSNFLISSHNISIPTSSHLIISSFSSVILLNVTYHLFL